MKNTNDKQKMLRLFIFNGVLLLVAFGLLEWWVRDYASFAPVTKGNMSKFEQLEEPKLYPEIVFVKAGHKALHNFSWFQNKWLIVNFWASWCAPCLTELPSLQKLQDEKGSDNFEVIAINMDLEGQKFYDFIGLPPKDKTAKRLNEMSIVRFWEHKNKIEKAVKFRGYPTTWIVDPYGRVVAILAGEADWSSEDAYTLVDSFAKTKKSD